MPASKPDEQRVQLLKAVVDGIVHCNPVCMCFSLNRVSSCQAFYEDQLTNDFRSERFWALAKQNGWSRTRFDKCIEDGKVMPANFVLLSTGHQNNQCTSTRQIPETFSFLDVHSKKGLNEEMAKPTCLVCDFCCFTCCFIAYSKKHTENLRCLDLLGVADAVRPEHCIHDGMVAIICSQRSN